MLQKSNVWWRIPVIRQKQRDRSASPSLLRCRGGVSAGRKNGHSLSHHWCTPPEYVELVREFFGGAIDLDPYSNGFSAVSATVEYRLPDQDGLMESWNCSTIDVNPPSLLA